MEVLNNAQQELFVKEAAKIKHALFFEYENDFYKGDKFALLHEFVSSNSNISFKKWLNEKGIRVKLLK